MTTAPNLVWLTVVTCSVKWLGRQDSNLGSRDQNPLPYRLATPHQSGARSLQRPVHGSAPIAQENDEDSDSEDDDDRYGQGRHDGRRDGHEENEQLGDGCDPRHRADISASVIAPEQAVEGDAPERQEHNGPPREGTGQRGNTFHSRDDECDLETILT
jgi:hypothetical protein